MKDHTMLRWIVPIALLFSASFAHADSVADFYAGKTLQIIVGYPSGSAYDIYARLVARHFGRHVPGSPNVVVSNQPGASSLIAANALANSSVRDGTVIAALFERIGLEPLVRPGSARFDGRAFGWIGSALKVTDVCMFWHTAPAKTIEEAKEREVIVGAAGDAGNTALAARMLNAYVGTKFKIVSGYGGADLFIAMERGETQARCGMSWGGLKASRPNWLKEGKLLITVQMAMQKHPELENVPLIMDMVTKPGDRAALEYLYGTQEMGRPFAAPPGIPADRLSALRRAFDATMQDPEFLADAQRSNLEVEGVTGERASEIIERLYQTPRSVIEAVETLRNAN
jgi:tripartite-type tricarboxylate transporter receptor subunit TctC